MRWTSSSGFPAHLSVFALACMACQEQAKPVSCEPSISGSPCERWRKSSCMFAERCELEAPDCLSQYARLSCSSSELATRCADQLLSATCEAPPSDCDVDAVADLRSAVSGCEQYTKEICQSAVACEISSDQTQCLEEAAIDCSTALALTESFDACLLEIADLDCSAWVLPSRCEGVIILR